MIERRRKILVIEDEESLLSTLQDELEAGGFDVLPTVSGEEALRRATDDPPDLILLDLLLPGIGGMGVLSVLKSHDRTRGIPVIILSNVGDESQVQEALELGADAYFVKTKYNLKDILEEIHVLLKTGRG